jgi:hypothetical protein
MSLLGLCCHNKPLLQCPLTKHLPQCPLTKLEIPAMVPLLEGPWQVPQPSYPSTFQADAPRLVLIGLARYEMCRCIPGSPNKWQVKGGHFQTLLNSIYNQVVRNQRLPLEILKLATILKPNSLSIQNNAQFKQLCLEHGINSTIRRPKFRR